MPTIVATPTILALDLIPRYWGGSLALEPIDQFRVGEGGWIQTLAGRVARTPDPSLTDLDVAINPSRYPLDSRASFAKALAPGDITYTSLTDGGMLEVTCLLDFGEFNDDGYGNFPNIQEIGLFSDNPSAPGKIMVAYVTLAMQEKNPAVQLSNAVKISFRL